MRGSTRGVQDGARTAVLLLIAALVLPLGLALGAAAPASANPYDRFHEDWVPAPGGVGHIKVRMWLANNGSNKAVYLLDGIRATNDVSGWEHETNAAWLSDHGVNVIEPVGGESSFYADWYAPNNFTNQPYKYMWESFLTQNLPDHLAARYGISRTSNAVVGLSMGGNAALILAAHHRNQFTFAGAMSGYLNLSAPGMREAIRIAMLDAGLYNSDCMWGPPWDPAWLRHDPFVQAEGLRGLPMWISAASGLPGVHNRPVYPIDYVNTATGMGLEALSLAQTRAFQVRLMTMGIDSAHFDFPATGTHAWPYWQDQLWAMLPMLKGSIGA
ncbi:MULTISPECIES: alpha/beta hydrolase family protein [unclassified Rhodococcus (in: high G+C Gram-positive bacteria)]|jgi:diacylglycerol O-acyltransferase / trehalose O-mycolyltransferase|uniref:alpha/beta hydrolase n=1 Tax=unclassified Rhodococcus (in: high G+C Gram-positive bacteria) TaxID=192944 RepID=UPI000BD40DE2|nr:MULTISPECIES: alpha/beta hydrolase family protein [unclassified Rhodococcus (in: high G+C Gram-positive bacteria)]MBP1159104.1 diacylglycerol O-acyltransferase/trehalose O-mycolyltransferase [Rhodococcus sp. PvR099]PTR39011.1 diacylglycerol O-acyltransferase/trehalose O-mycolyltransferase [Rhodococcus sp. OK611]SNX92797.1 diacylglycerol O-acyltransferase / trehalose O-mycolyltransferase [Rhodococcus sp. OK270]